MIGSIYWMYLSTYPIYIYKKPASMTTVDDQTTSHHEGGWVGLEQRWATAHNIARWASSKAYNAITSFYKETCPRLFEK